jgi:hypothetical protein
VKVTKHIEQLLRQGRKPKELIDLGFAKATVTREYRRLKEEKTTIKAKTPEGTAQAETPLSTLPESPETIAAIWQKVQSMANDLQRIDSLIQALSEVSIMIAATCELGTDRRQNCPYQEDGVCIARGWSGQDDIPQGIGEPVLVGDENTEWYVKPSPFYCAMCTAFLKDRIDDVESEVSGNPLSGARYQITCQSCGSKGYIAAAVKCTKCGHETYWGWRPKGE